MIADWTDPSDPEVRCNRTVHVDYEKVFGQDGLFEDDFVKDVVAYPEIDSDLLDLIEQGVHIWFWPCALVPRIRNGDGVECEIATTWRGPEEELKHLVSSRRGGTHFLTIQNKGAVLVAVMPVPKKLRGLSVHFYAPRVVFDAGIPLKMTKVMPVWETWIEGSGYSAEAATFGEYSYLSEVVKELAKLCEENYPWRFKEASPRVPDEPPSHSVWPPNVERPQAAQDDSDEGGLGILQRVGRILRK